MGDDTLRHVNILLPNNLTQWFQHPLMVLAWINYFTGQGDAEWWVSNVIIASTFVGWWAARKSIPFVFFYGPFLSITDFLIQFLILLYCHLLCVTQVVPNLVESAFTSVPMFFDTNLLAFEYFLTYCVLGSPCTLPQSWNQSFLQGSLVPFSGQWNLETNI